MKIGERKREGRQGKGEEEIKIKGKEKKTEVGSARK